MPEKLFFGILYRHMKTETKHIIFKGRVQGVGFRFTALNVANRSGITGYIKNLPNGTVEMVAQGNAEDIDYTIERLRDSFSQPIQTEIRKVSSDKFYEEFKITF